MTTRDQLIDATADLLWERGYTATSPSVIQKRSGAGQGSMYHHFSGKADLAAAAMRRTAEQMRQEVLAASAGHDSAIERVHAYLDQERAPLRGCRLGRLAQDPDVIDDETLRGPLSDYFSWLRHWIAEVLDFGQRSGELRPDFDPQQIAGLVVATVQGGYVLARADQDPALHALAVQGAKAAISNLAAR